MLARWCEVSNCILINWLVWSLWRFSERLADSMVCNFNCLNDLIHQGSPETILSAIFQKLNSISISCSRLRFREHFFVHRNTSFKSMFCCVCYINIHQTIVSAFQTSIRSLKLKTWNSSIFIGSAGQPIPWFRNAMKWPTFFTIHKIRNPTQLNRFCHAL